MYCTIDATKLTTDRHEASRDLFATADWAELLVWHTVGRWNSQAMVQLGWRIWGSTGETYKLLSRSNSRSNDCTKPRRIVTMTPNKLAVYFVADIFVADIVLADMVVADIDFPCGQYGFFSVADIVLLWPIWSHPTYQHRQHWWAWHHQHRSVPCFQHFPWQPLDCCCFLSVQQMSRSPSQLWIEFCVLSVADWMLNMWDTLCFSLSRTSPFLIYVTQLPIMRQHLTNYLTRLTPYGYKSLDVLRMSD